MYLIHQPITRHSTGGRAALLLRLFSSPPAWAPLILRLTLAGVMLPHGAQKVLGVFGGQGFRATFHAFTTDLGLPSAVALFVILTEFVGALFVFAGLGTRLAGLAFIGLMIGAIVTVHAPNGFFMNWFGQQSGEGFEYHLLAIGIALALVVAGGGRGSVDRWIAARIAARLDGGAS